MRFLADENVSAKLVAFLRSVGHDIRCVDKGASDSDAVTRAKSESRVLLTHDTDFADRDLYPASTHSGIVLIRINPRHLDGIQAALARLLATHSSPDSFTGRVWLVFEDTTLEFKNGSLVPLSP